MNSSTKSGCSKCGCKSFSWNPVSAGQKLLSGINVNLNFGVVSGSLSTMSSQDNTSKQVAYKNCTCGHHYNYHS